MRTISSARCCLLPLLERALFGKGAPFSWSAQSWKGAVDHRRGTRIGAFPGVEAIWPHVGEILFQEGSSKGRPFLRNGVVPCGRPMFRNKSGLVPEFRLEAGTPPPL